MHHRKTADDVRTYDKGVRPL